jgi:hypothetical protein
VSRLWAKDEGLWLRIDTIGPKIAERSGPGDQYFFVTKEHPNYNGLFSLALAAAANRWRLSIQTREDITTKKHAEVWYFVVDWDAGQG